MLSERATLGHIHEGKRVSWILKCCHPLWTRNRCVLKWAGVVSIQGKERITGSQLWEFSWTFRPFRYVRGPGWKAGVRFGGVWWFSLWVHLASCQMLVLHRLRWSYGFYPSFYLFLLVNLFLLVLGLRCCVGAFSSCSEWRLLSSCGAQASQCSGSSCFGTCALGCMGLGSCGIWAKLLPSLWNPPRMGIEPTSLALAGRFLTTGPPGKSILHFINVVCHIDLWMLNHLVSLEWLPLDHSVWSFWYFIEFCWLIFKVLIFNIKYLTLFVVKKDGVSTEDVKLGSPMGTGARQKQ